MEGERLEQVLELIAHSYKPEMLVEIIFPQQVVVLAAEQQDQELAVVGSYNRCTVLPIYLAAVQMEQRAGAGAEDQRF